MSWLAPHHVELLTPLWFASAAAGLLVGYAAGLFHFRSLQTVARRFVDGNWTAVPLQVARLAVLGAVLFALALWGAQVLIPGAAGILLARRRVLARTGAEL